MKKKLTIISSIIAFSLLAPTLSLADFCGKLESEATAVGKANLKFPDKILGKVKTVDFYNKNKVNTSWLTVVEVNPSHNTNVKPSHIIKVKCDMECNCTEPVMSKLTNGVNPFGAGR